MNKYQRILTALSIMITISLICLLTVNYINNKAVKHIDLPEEYKLITKDTPIRGYFTKDSVLVIEFDHNIQFEWEGAQSDIPSQGNIQVSGKINNIVYLNPIDE